MDYSGKIEVGMLTTLALWEMTPLQRILHLLSEIVWQYDVALQAKHEDVKPKAGV